MAAALRLLANDKLKVVYKQLTPSRIAGITFGLLVLALGVLNAFLVHLVPGVVYGLLSLVYFPATNVYQRSRFHVSIPPGVKIVLGIVILWFTLGISDLGDMID
jgi:hypothetical protein